MTVLDKSPTIGRPLKLTQKVIDTISQVVAEGNYFITACRIAGVGEVTFYGWLNKAREELDAGLSDTPYIKLLKALEKAEAEAEALRVSRIKKAGAKNWLADMTHLERRHPERWARRDRTTVDINETKRVTITHVTVVKDYGEGGQITDGEYKELPAGDSEK